MRLQLKRCRRIRRNRGVLFDGFSVKTTTDVQSPAERKDAFKRGSGGSGGQENASAPDTFLKLMTLYLSLTFFFFIGPQLGPGLCLEFPLVSVVSLVRRLMSAADVAQLW